MSDNPEETPNPLNPKPTEEFVSEPDMAPSEPANSTAPNPNSVIDGFIAKEKVDEIKDPMTSEVNIGVSETVVQTEAATPTTPDPMDRPMEKAPVPEEVKPVKKKKTGLIVGAIICLLIAVGCAAAAVVVLNNRNEDAVSRAINKIVNGTAPTKVVIDGNIDMNIADQDSLFSKLSVNLNSGLMLNSMINATEAEITATLQGGNEQVKLKISEIYATSGDVYLRLDGINEVIDGLTMRESLLNSGEEVIVDDAEIEVDTVEIESNDMLAWLQPFSGLIEVIDGEWLNISTDELEELIKSDENKVTNCVTNLLSEANNNSNSLAKLYSNNAFIVSDNDALVISSKNDPVYKLAIDDEKFTNFIDGVNNSKIMEDLANCIGNKGAGINAEEAVDELKNLPDIFVEIDENYNFTRLYFEYGDADSATIKVDLSFSYPANINVSEPTEYQNLFDILQRVYTQSQATE